MKVEGDLQYDLLALSFSREDLIQSKFDEFQLVHGHSSIHPLQQLSETEVNELLLMDILCKYSSPFESCNAA